MHANVAHHEQLLQAQNDTWKGTFFFVPFDGMEWDGWAETIRCIPIELDRTWPCGSSKAQTAGREPSRVQPWFLRRAFWWFRMTWDSNNINNHQQPTVGRFWMVLMGVLRDLRICFHLNCVVWGFVMAYHYEMIKRNQNPYCTTSDVTLCEVYFCWSWNGWWLQSWEASCSHCIFKLLGYQRSAPRCTGARCLSWNQWTNGTQQFHSSKHQRGSQLRLQSRL